MKAHQFEKIEGIFFNIAQFELAALKTKLPMAKNQCFTAIAINEFYLVQIQYDMFAAFDHGSHLGLERFGIACIQGFCGKGDNAYISDLLNVQCHYKATSKIPLSRFNIKRLFLSFLPLGRA
jgi:hypothetical protein